MALMLQWTVEALNVNTGALFVIGHWLDLRINQTIAGTSVDLGLIGSSDDAARVHELETDLLFFRGATLVHRLRVVTVDDALDANTHVVKISAVSYDVLLRRRVLTAPAEINGEQIGLAWGLIAATQAKPNGDLGITNASTPTSTIRQRTFAAGMGVYDAIDSLASVAGGFDWWIDAERKFRTQSPRRVRDRGIDLAYGAQVSAVSRQSNADLYSSAVLVIGATTETTLPGGTTYPPPNPVYRSAPSMPVGLWEHTYSYPDVVTQASVDAKADWHLTDAARLRPQYTVTLEPTVYSHEDYQPGDLLTLRIGMPPRLDITEQVRIEEIQVALTPDGGEDVVLSTRVETGEPVEGRTIQRARITMADGFASLLSGLNDRLRRVERVS